jgi:hypothetical protein
MPNMSKDNTFDLLDSIYEQKGYRPTVHDARDHGWQGSSAAFCLWRSQWIGDRNIKRNPGGTREGDTSESAYVPENLAEVAEQVRQEGLAKRVAMTKPRTRR